MKRYPEYRETEYNWLGSIPSQWKWLYLSQSCKEQDIKNVGNAVSDVLSLSYGQIIRRKNIDFGLAPKDYSTYQIVDNGNIILRLTDLQNDHKSLRTGLVRERGIITSAYVCLQTSENPAYIQYLLHSYDTQKYFYGLGGGVRQSIGYKDIRYIKIPLPPRDEQDRIVRFLDWKVSWINKLINAKRRQIELLREQKQAVINEVVTKGGEGWQEVTLGNLGSFRKGFGGSREDDTESGGAACIRYGDIYRSGALFLDEPITRITLESSVYYARVYKSEVLFALSGETKEEIGQALVNSIDKDTWCSGDTAIFTANDSVLPAFLTYAMRCPHIIQQRASIAKGDIIVHISTSALRRLRILVPPIEQQKVIVSMLDDVCTAIEKTTKNESSQITLLAEYRTRLVSDVVTGKLDVRGVAVPEYEAVEDVGEDDNEALDEKPTEDGEE